MATRKLTLKQKQLAKKNRKQTKENRKQNRKQKKQSRKQKKRTQQKQRGGAYPLLPQTLWGPGWPMAATQASPTGQLPAPLANGGMYTGPQSTGPWASTPFPPTQYAHALETGPAFFHQRPNDNFGASFSPAFPNPPVNHKL
uniref:Uncharacterized protein n=1 Tax=viral metagenome TaxID=1070528 RepID=A0A6C0BJ37_9ZZZZ